MKKQTNNLNSEKKFSFKNIFLSWWPLISVAVIALTLFIFGTIEKTNFEKRFISPTSNSVYNQEGETYIIATYFEKDASSYTFVQELKKMEKKYNIPFYLIDVKEYGQDLIDAWNLVYSPSYFIMKNENNEEKATLLYKSYGAKKADVLKLELEYCEKNGGIPIDHVGQTSEDSSLKLNVLLSSIEKKENNDVELTFKITNYGSNSFVFNSSYLYVADFVNENKTATINYTGDILVANGASETIKVTVSGADPLKIRIRMDLTGLGGSTHKWFVSKLNNTIDLESIE